ncbi:DUF6046 domain-containing protein [uncultured Draconibacterium sp.]|uniref:DUF6046 domain-containing protein n=1 Tax=uncultured Draconibacterium sp. TaxID=1573823 RepID=UPI00260111EC|nr:DUF6046 domain-containing protein [uncultured Draconibacterium sp.]
MANLFKIATTAYATATGYVAPPFIPVEMINRPKAKSFDKGEFAEKETQSVNGAPLRKYQGGIYYFMPVVINHDGTKWEFNNAVVSVAGKKSIVETPLVGRQGTVKELINIQDYEIKLVALLSGDDYPEQEVMDAVKLWEINENVKMECAITDYFLKDEDRVVIKHIDFPAMEGEEDSQAIVMTLVSDQNFELEL